MRNGMAFVLGIVFALGLGVSGMTDPTIVLGFLDFAGDWNPALAFVMGSAIPIYMIAWYWRRGRGAMLMRKSFPTPRHDFDRSLFLGAGLFGIGWGLAGICPGPAVTILGRPSAGSIVFVACVLVGMALYRFTLLPRSNPA